jgi:hypothetical protein
VNLSLDKLNIVLVGAFNPAILTPKWIAQNALGYGPDQAFQVEFVAPVTGFGGVPTFTFDGIAYSPSFQSVTFHLANSNTMEARQRVLSVVVSILSKLPHTPVQGVGLNFGFTVPNPTAQLQALAKAHDELSEALSNGESDGEIVARSWSNTVTWKGALVTMQLLASGPSVSIDANFHYNASSAAAAVEALQGDGVYELHFNAAVAAATSITGQELQAA